MAPLETGGPSSGLTQPWAQSPFLGQAPWQVQGARGVAALTATTALEKPTSCGSTWLHAPLLLPLAHLELDTDPRKVPPQSGSANGIAF